MGMIELYKSCLCSQCKKHCNDTKKIVITDNKAEALKKAKCPEYEREVKEVVTK